MDCKEPMKDLYFQDSMNNIEADAWSSFILVVRNFQRKYKANNYFEQVESLLSSFT